MGYITELHFLIETSRPVQKRNESNKRKMAYVNKVFSQFWDFENVPQTKHSIKLKSECVEHSDQTTKQNDD